MTKINWEQLQKEQGEWANRNFPQSGKSKGIHPLYGVIEEFGELCHSLLKQKQGIRGTTEEHEAKAKDAVGDIMIYSLDIYNRRDWELSFIQSREWYSKIKGKWSEEELVMEATYCLGRAAKLLTKHGGRCQMWFAYFFDALIALCNLRGWDFEQCVQDAWDEVSKRDWVNNPKNGETNVVV